MAEILIYAKTICPYCVWAKRLLAAKGAGWREIDVSRDAESFSEIPARSGGRRTAPQIFVRNRHIGGWQQLTELERRGRLDSLLAGGSPYPDGGTPDDRTAATDDEVMEESSVGDNRHSVIILGSGCAGLTAAVYAARANLEPLVVEGPEFGGQLYTTTDVENFPGFPEGIQGPELIDRMKAQAERFGAHFVSGRAKEIDFSGRPFTVVLGDDSRHRCDALIVATGASPRLLGLPNELALRGHGVSTCATCDGAFFRDEEVAVVGGGDTAMEDSLFLTRFARKVYVLHRRDELRASKIMQDRAFANDKIEFLWNTEVKAFHGDAESGLTGLRVVDNETGDERDLEVSGCFVAIGHDPNTELLKSTPVRLDEQGYVSEDGRHFPFTDVEGVFVAGDVHDHRYRQAVTAAGHGCRAAMDAEKFLEAHSTA